jgi:hypothetical protein
MKKYLLIILTLLSLSACSQTKSETTKPKQFLSDDALEFDLVGEIKKINWIVIDSTTAGNNSEYCKGYFKGTIDSIKLLYNKDFKLIQSDLVRWSIKTYDKNADGKVVFKNENILLDKFSDIAADDLSQTSYRSLIKENKLIEAFGLHQLFYNQYGDVKEAQVLNKEYPKGENSTEKIEYKYKYDKIGNWIERTIITGTQKERFVTQTDIRKIEYQ